MSLRSGHAHLPAWAPRCNGPHKIEFNFLNRNLMVRAGYPPIVDDDAEDRLSITVDNRSENGARKRWTNQVLLVGGKPMKASLRKIMLPPLVVSISLTSLAQADAASDRFPSIDPALGVWTAPIGHRQPSTSDVPAAVLKSEGTITDRQQKLDKRLNICRGC